MAATALTRGERETEAGGGTGERTAMVAGRGRGKTSLCPHDVPLSLQFLPRSWSLSQPRQGGPPRQGPCREPTLGGARRIPTDRYTRNTWPLPMPRVAAMEKIPCGTPSRTGGHGAATLPRASVSLWHPRRGHPQAGMQPHGRGSRRRRRRRKRRRAAPSRAHKAPFIGAEFGFPPPAQHLAASCPARNAAVGAGDWRVGRFGGGVGG